MRVGQMAAAGGASGAGVTPTPVVLGRYRLQRRLGAGGFGTVWMARDEHLQRDVAVKILPRERIVGGRFDREARAAARLSHPAIVTLFEAATDDEGAYLVSELVHGSTLDRALADGRLSDRRILAVGTALCEALAHAHAHGIVHRDVKPSNILIPGRTPSSASPAKLTDFGVARVVGGDALTHTGELVGTWQYMAPEQAMGRPAGEEADLYALAVVLYEALTGVNPLLAVSARPERRVQHLPPLRRQRRDLPRELGQVVDQALRPRARERGSLVELSTALRTSADRVNDVAGVVGPPRLALRRRREWRSVGPGDGSAAGPPPTADDPAARPPPPVDPPTDATSGADDGAAGAATTAWPTRVLTALSSRRPGTALSSRRPGTALTSHRRGTAPTVPQPDDAPDLPPPHAAPDLAPPHTNPDLAPPDTNPDPPAPHARTRRARLPAGPGERLAAAAAAAALAAWVASALLAPPPLAPPTAALVAALVVLVVPRLGWLVMGLGATVVLCLQHRSGLGLVLLSGVLAPAVAMPRRGSAWPLAGLAPALGAIGLAGAWPALAARAGSWWRRAAVAAVGWWWVCIGTALSGHRLYLRPPAVATAVWADSPYATVHHVLGPLIAGPAPVAAVWALGAVALPLLLRVPVRRARRSRVPPVPPDHAPIGLAPSDRASDRPSHRPSDPASDRPSDRARGRLAAVPAALVWSALLGAATILALELTGAGHLAPTVAVWTAGAGLGTVAALAQWPRSAGATPSETARFA